MKKLLLATVLFGLLSTKAHAMCGGIKPFKPMRMCNGTWQLVCVQNGYYENYWNWICVSSDAW